MEFEGTIKKDTKSLLWLVEIPPLDLTTQGTSKDDALFMAKDAVMELLQDSFPEKLTKDVLLDAYFHDETTFGITSNNSTLLIALTLRRKREKAGISIREVTHRLQTKSRNAYAQYEQGKINISIAKLDSFFRAIDPAQHCSLRIV